jgi:hypothetical protein
MITLYVVNEKGPIELRDENMSLLDLKLFSADTLTYLLKSVYADIKQKEPQPILIQNGSIQLPAIQTTPSYIKEDVRTYSFNSETYIVNFSHLT